MASRNQRTRRNVGFFQKNIYELSVWNRIVLFLLAGGTFIFSFLMMLGSFGVEYMRPTILPYTFAVATICSFAALTGVFRGLNSNENAAPKVSKPKTSSAPKPRQRKSAIPKEYKVILKKLENIKKDAQDRYNSVEALLQEYFGDSAISIARYTDVLTKANDVLEQNYEHANNAVKLFGSSKPTPARLEILTHYVHDSEDVLNKINQIVDELIRVHQSSSFEKGDVLDARLDELVQTTHYYANKSEENQQSSNQL